MLFLFEFYNAIDAPCIFLEKTVPFTDISVEAISWIGDFVVGACFDGSLICSSPFTTLIKVFTWYKMRYCINFSVFKFLLHPFGASPQYPAIKLQ